MIETAEARAAIGPYSQAVIHEGKIHTSGQILFGLDGKIVGDTIEEQAHQVLQKLSSA